MLTRRLDPKGRSQAAAARQRLSLGMHRRVNSEGDPFFSKELSEEDRKRAEAWDEDQDLIDTARAECSQVGWRLRQEFYLFQQQWWKLIILWGWWYVVCPLAMNTAYYRYKAGPLLRDLGFELIPQMPRAYAHLSELPFKVLILIVVAMIVSSVARGGATTAYGMNALIRWCSVFSIAHTLRAMTFLSTTLPGVAAHCLQDFDWQANQPKSAFTLLPNPGWPSKNCGDLVFSGHMTVTLVSLCVLFKYGQRMFALSDGGFRGLMTFAIILCITQAMLIITVRHHYTIDVVVASYLIPLLWDVFGHRGPADMAVDKAAIARKVLGRPLVTTSIPLETV